MRSPRRSLAAISRVRRLTADSVWSMAREMAYRPSEQSRPDLVALKSFMRQAFQALAYNDINGDYAEFGCFGGRTFVLAKGAAGLVGHSAHLWAFDSFEGLPASDDPRDAHVGWSEGAMAMTEQAFITHCRNMGLTAHDFTTVKGFYSDTLISDASGPRPDRVCFAYIDCDLYSSTSDVLRFLGPRLCNGAVIAFDDYFCFSKSHPSGERIAAIEYFERNDQWDIVPYIQWGWNGMSFMVESKNSAIPPSLLRL
jgi:O-methyltransferase